MEQAPAEIRLVFTEPVSSRLTSIRIAALDTGDVREAAVEGVGSNAVVVRPGALDRGAYRVEWHTVSRQDGHALEGSFSIGIRAPAAAGKPVLEQSPLARSGWLRIVLRTFLYVAALLFVAALILPAFARDRAGWLAPAALGDTPLAREARCRVRVLTENLGWLAATAAAAAVLAEARDAAGSFAPRAVSDYLLASGAGAARVAVVGLLLAAAAACRRLPRFAAALAVLALGAVAISGHSSSASPRAVSVLNDWAHLVSGSVWLGGIGLVGLVWSRSLRGQDTAVRAAVARHVLVPFGHVALTAFLGVVVTGLVSLVIQLGELTALWSTAYGRLLLVKIVMVGAIGAASATHALRLRFRLLDGSSRPGDDRRHWRLVRSEPWLGLVVVALAAALVVFPLPPRQLGEAADARSAAPACERCPLPVPAPDELAVAEQAGSHVVAAWLRREGDQVRGTLRVSDGRGRPADVALDATGLGASCGTGCWEVAAPASTGTLRVGLIADGRRFDALLPARWQQDANRRARRLLGSAQRAMRGLGSLRQVEEITSGPGTYARTVFRLSAPDRMTFATDQDVAAVVIGRRQWTRVESSSWDPSKYGGGLPFATRRWFRWTVYGRAVRLLGTTREGGRRIAQLALYDEGTPVWIRLGVDLRSRRVVGERMIARAHYMRTRYLAFNRPARIRAPARPGVE